MTSLPGPGRTPDNSPRGASPIERTVGEHLGASLAEDTPVYVISVAALLSGLHPQTLRQYDRLGLVSPARTSGRNRMYSMRDIGRLMEVQQLAEAGLNLEGIRRILELEEEVRMLRRRIDQLTSQQRSTALVIYRPPKRGR